MTRKVYRSKHFMHLTITIRIKGEPVQITFEGGSAAPRRINGDYSTTDPVKQVAIENHPKYGKSFELVKTIDMSTGKPFQPTYKAPEAEKPVEAKGIVSEAKNSQEAKYELNKKYNIPWSQLKNAAAVLDHAEKLDISYPNWERPQ